MEKKLFYEDLNILRAIAVIYVVIGHVVPVNSFIHDFIYQFHMPMFFFLSGLLYSLIPSRNQTKVSKIQSKFTKLMIPYLFCSIVSAILKVFLGRFAKNELSLKSLPFNILTGVDNPNGGIWFLYTLFFIYSLAILFDRKDKNKINYMYILFIIIGIIINIFRFDVIVLSRLFSNSIYFFVGFYARIIYLKVAEKNKSFIYLLCGVLFIVLSTWNINCEEGNNLIIKYIIIVLAISFNYGLAKAISKTNTIKKIMSEIGKYGMDIYIIGYYIQETLRLLIISIFHMNIYVFMMLGFFLIIYGSIIISKYIVRKFKILNLLVLGK